MPSSNSNMTWLSGLFIVFLTVIFGVNAVAIKMSLSGMGPLTNAGLRFALAAVAIFCWARVTGRSFCIQTGQAPQLLIVSIAFMLQLSLMYLGLKRTFATRGVLVSNLLPFFVLFLSHWFIPGERITRKKTMGIMLGFGGVAFMFLGARQDSGSFQIGDLIILSAVVVWSCNVVYTKRIINDFEPFHLVLYPMILSTPILLAAGFLWDDRMLFRLNPTVIVAFAYQSLITAAFGFVAWNSMLKRFGATTLHAFVFIMPIAGVVTGGLLLNEPITSNLLLALALIAAGIALVHMSPKKPTVTFPLGRGL